MRAEYVSFNTHIFQEWLAKYFELIKEQKSTHYHEKEVPFKRFTGMTIDEAIIASAGPSPKGLTQKESLDELERKLQEKIKAEEEEKRRIEEEEKEQRNERERIERERLASKNAALPPKHNNKKKLNKKELKRREIERRKLAREAKKGKTTLAEQNSSSVNDKQPSDRTQNGSSLTEENKADDSDDSFEDIGATESTEMQGNEAADAANEGPKEEVDYLCM